MAKGANTGRASGQRSDLGGCRKTWLKDEIKGMGVNPPLKPGWSEQNRQRLLESFKYAKGFLRILKALIDLANVTGAQRGEGLISVSFVGVAFVGLSINQSWIH